jgi:hypothetical protein
MKVDEAWLLKNGVSRETLDECLKEGSVQQPLVIIDPEITFGPVIWQGTTTWLPIHGWRPAALNELERNVKTKIRLKKRDRDVLCAGAREWNIGRASGKRRLGLQIRVPKHQRRWDTDAFFKSLQDAAKHAGLIVDDSPVWFSCGRCDYDPQRGPLRTTLILEDL